MRDKRRGYYHWILTLVAFHGILIAVAFSRAATTFPTCAEQRLASACSSHPGACPAIVMARLRCLSICSSAITDASARCLRAGSGVNRCHSNVRFTSKRVTQCDRVPRTWRQ
jgi:hypothetical protein